MASKELQFEEALQRLESVIEKLENDKAGLDESLALYEEGMKLVRHCNTCLDKAEQRVEAVRLTAEGAVTEPFEVNG